MTAVGAQRPSAPGAVARAAASERRRTGRLELAALAAVLLGAVAVRAVLLRVPMRYDEAFSFLTYATQPLGFATSSYGTPNNHVFNTVLMHFSWEVFGDHLWSIRLPAFLAGCAVPPAAYLVARRLYGRGAALWAAALAASSAPLIDFSANGRGYTLGLALLLVALWCAVAAMDRGRAWGWAWAGFALCTALSFWSVPTMGPGLAAMALWVGAVLALRRDLPGLGYLAAALAGAALLAYLLYEPTLGQAGWHTGKELERSWSAVGDLAALTWHDWHRASRPLGWLVSAAFVAGLVLHRRMGRQPVPLALAAVVVAAVELAISPRLGGRSRHWIFLVPFYLLTAAAGFAWATEAIARRLRGGRVLAVAAPVCVAAALAALLLHAGQAGSEEPPQSDNQIVNYLRDELRPGEVAMQPQTFAPAVDYYFHRYGYPPAVGYVTPAMRQTGHAVVIIPGASPAYAAETMRELGAIVGKRPPRLLKRFEYISVWDVPIAG